MTTIAIELSPELKKEIADAAKQAGLSEQAYILAAIDEKLLWDNPAPEVYAEAERRWQKFQQTGMAIPHEEVVEYFERRLAGEQVDPPKARKIKG